MRRNLFVPLLLVCLTQSTFGQQPATPMLPADMLTAPAPFEDAWVIPRLWQTTYLGLDFLFWWMKPVCLKAPILSSGSPNDPVPGALGQPNTMLLLGQSRFEFGGTMGLRPKIGINLDRDGIFAFEVQGFELATAAVHQSYDSRGSLTPTYLVYQAPDNTQQALPFSVPGSINGAVDAIGSSRLWGIEANGIANLFDNARGPLHVQGGFLTGFRYLNLRDRIQLRNSQSLAADPSVSVYGEDTFSTLNEFYGVQIGSRLAVSGQRWMLEGVGKFAIGETNLISNFEGSPLVGTPLSPGLVPGPIQVLPSNAGEKSTYRITVVPEIATNLRVAITERLTFSMGYSVLYWNRILCPGDLMDTHVNITQLPQSAAVVGPRVPVIQPVHTDYFAQGFNVGLQFKF